MGLRDYFTLTSVKEKEKKEGAEVIKKIQSLARNAQMTVEGYLNSSPFDEEARAYIRDIIKRADETTAKTTKKQLNGLIKEKQIKPEKRFFSCSSFIILGIVIGIVIGFYLASVYGNRYVVTSSGLLNASTIKLDKWTGNTWMQRYYMNKEGYKVYYWKKLD